MFRHNGSTLVETLFAFSIYITIIVMFVSLISVINKSNIKLNNYYEDLRNEEYTRCEDFIDRVEMVLH